MWGFACALVLIATFRVVLADPRDAVLIEYHAPASADYESSGSITLHSGALHSGER